MASSKTVFIAFAKEDETTRSLFTGQRVHPKTPFAFTDMSVKEPYKTEWKARVQTRIKRSDGVIVLISSSTPKASGQLWEISCAVAEGRPIRGIWIEDGYRTVPEGMSASSCRAWTWDNVADFIDGL